MGRGGGGAIVISLSILVILAFSSAGAAAQELENCTTWGPPCDSRLAFFVSTEQSLADIANVFNVDLASILGANNLDITQLSVLANQTVPGGTLVQIPMKCECIETARRTNTTVYTVKSGDFLSTIADVIFGKLTTFQYIGSVNKIPNVNDIFTGDKYVIPFPCSCHNNSFGGAPAVILTYPMLKGDTLSTVASKFGLADDALSSINNNINASDVVNTRLKVPLHACLSDFDPSTQDRGLVVPNNTYALSPEDCVQCYCSGYPSANLQCIPSPALDKTACPSLECKADLSIGNFTTSVAADGQCVVDNCEYGGYVGTGMVKKREQQTKQPTCPVHPVLPPPNTLSTLMSNSTTTPSGSTTPQAPPGKAPAPARNGAIRSSDPLWSTVACLAFCLCTFLHLSWR